MSSSTATRSAVGYLHVAATFILFMYGEGRVLKIGCSFVSTTILVIDFIDSIGAPGLSNSIR